MRQTIVILFCVALWGSTALGQQPVADALPSVNLPPELARVLTDYEAAWQKRDPAALAKLFAEDGFVLANGRQPVRGRAAIESIYAGQGGPLSLRAIAFATDGTVGYIIGGFAAKKATATPASSR